MTPRIAISLGASFLGYATHAGFLARLHRLGVRPVAVGGSSAGAVAAGLYAAGLPEARIRDTVLDWTFRRSFVRATPWFTHYLRNTFAESQIGVFKPDAAVGYLERLLGPRRIEELRQPAFMAAVSDLEQSSTRFLREGSLARAMVASCCVPTIFSPLQHAGLACFDGGVAHEAPIDPWLEDPDVDVIVMHRVDHTPAPCPKFFPFNLFKLTAQAHACASQQLLEYRLRLAQLHGKRVLLTQTVHDRPALFSGRRMPDFYAAGEAQAQRFYEETLQPLLGS